MSYILDALKKSEQERSRGTIPDIKTVHQPRPVEHKKTSPWPYIVLTVLALSAGGLGFVIYQQNMLKKSDLSQGHQATVATTQVPSSQPSVNEISQNRNSQSTLNVIAQQSDFSNGTSANSQGSNPQGSTPQKSAEKSQSNRSAKETRDTGEANVIFSDEPLTVSEKELKNAESIDDLSALSDVQIIPDTDSSAGDFSELPSKSLDDKVYDIVELPDSVKRALPAISFAGHVYSSTQSQRSVMLNGKKMREGQEVTKGLVLEEITVEGVVLRSQGYRFKLGALQDWSFQ
ncbi:general secretion pathway protein GspB [Kaarinaea lacus]